jgi:hypothetical protein
LLNVYDAHTKSEEGVSSIIKLNTESTLVWGSIYNEIFSSGNTLIATASLGSPEIRIWLLKIQEGTISLTPHIRIETSMNEGVRYLLEAKWT